LIFLAVFYCSKKINIQKGASPITLLILEVYI